MGDLGRHTEMGPDGLPVLTHRTEVFLIVSPYAPWKMNGSFKLLDCFRLSIDPNVNLRVHQNRCVTFLQPVEPSVLNLDDLPLILCSRLFGGGKFGVLLYAMIVLMIGWTIAFFFANLLQCTPIRQNWTGYGGTVDACINTVDMYLGQAYSDVISDGKYPQSNLAKRSSCLVTSKANKT